VKTLFLFGFTFLLLSIITYAQNWFPLEIGNRWDYFVEIQIPGGNTSYDTLSIEIIDYRVLPNGLEYFEFSETLPFGWFPPSKLLREEDNNFYYFEEDDSTDCFSLRFDLPADTFYMDCKGIQKNIFWIDTSFTFGFQDIHQNQEIFYDFSYNFGAYQIIIPWVVNHYYTLKGCIISGIVYGSLLVSVQNDYRIPEIFSLFQNYPNPFNPTTTIKYQIPEISIVTLKVYDVLGSEVATLVNEKRLAGTYEVEFDGNGLLSGIYFYHLRAGSFVETKKMILIK